MKTVGIIGGLGPETTSKFYLDIIFSCYQKDTTTRPSVLITSVPLPYKIEEDLITENKGVERYLPFLKTEAQRLEKAGADFIIMPCNSLHVFISEIQSAVQVPVLSIVEETLAFMKKNIFKKVGVISTAVTAESGLYETALTQADVEYEKPDSSEQAKLGQLIHRLVMGTQKDEDRTELIRIMDGLASRGVDCVLLACTDLQLLVPEHRTLKVFDTMKILVDATVREILK